MGWCSGTEIFDTVMNEALPYIPTEVRPKFIEAIAQILWDGDWDCESDSDYYELLEPIMIKRGYIDK